MTARHFQILQSGHRFIQSGKADRILQIETAQVAVPSNLTLGYLSYRCDSIVVSATTRLHTFFKKRFTPDHDLSFTWQIQQAAWRTK